MFELCSIGTAGGPQLVQCIGCVKWHKNCGISRRIRSGKCSASRTRLASDPTHSASTSHHCVHICAFCLHEGARSIPPWHSQPNPHVLFRRRVHFVQQVSVRLCSRVCPRAAPAARGMPPQPAGQGVGFIDGKLQESCPFSQEEAAVYAALPRLMPAGAFHRADFVLRLSALRGYHKEKPRTETTASELARILEWRDKNGMDEVRLWRSFWRSAYQRVGVSVRAWAHQTVVRGSRQRFWWGKSRDPEACLVCCVRRSRVACLVARASALAAGTGALCPPQCLASQCITRT
jgi:hypothetical protein